MNYISVGPLTSKSVTNHRPRILSNWSNAKRIFWLLLSYFKTRHLRFTSRDDLERYQAKRLNQFLHRLSARSPYFADYQGVPLKRWPAMDKKDLIASFDVMNTVNLRIDDVIAMALQSERSRDFTPTMGDVTVGLSSGTSGHRGLFAVSSREQAQWAGVILAKMLPRGIFKAQQIAMFLRANSNLYTAVRTRWLNFTFYDLFDPFTRHIECLNGIPPSILIAPAQVLRQLALATRDGRLQIAPMRVISVAEVLEPQDRALIREVWGEVHEIYQATEGLVASSCSYGVLHLNEEHLYIEADWVDREQRRFRPIITDFNRFTQPIVRYHLNDILIAREAPCQCGLFTRSLEGIEGRNDDMLLLPGQEQDCITVFADLLSRVFVRSLPLDADYRLIQTAAATLHLYANVGSTSCLQQLKNDLDSTLENLGVAVDSINWKLSLSIPAFDPTVKRRRIARKQWDES